jgi:hypothetical protein
MPRVKLADLVEGMVVTVDVKNMDDMLLIPAGCPLTDKHIQILQSWGIPDVNVESVTDAAGAQDPLAQISPEELGRLTVEMKARFLRFDETSPLQQEMLRLALRRSLKQPRTS